MISSKPFARSAAAIRPSVIITRLPFRPSCSASSALRGAMPKRSVRTVLGTTRAFCRTGACQLAILSTVNWLTDRIMSAAGKAARAAQLATGCQTSVPCTASTSLAPVRRFTSAANGIRLMCPQKTRSKGPWRSAAARALQTKRPRPDAAAAIIAHLAGHDETIILDQARQHDNLVDPGQAQPNAAMTSRLYWAIPPWTPCASLTSIKTRIAASLRHLRGRPQGQLRHGVVQHGARQRA